MRVAIVAPGSRGDVEPYIALGTGLKNAGHIVRLVTHQDFEGLVALHGVEFWPLEGKVQDIVQSQDMRALLEGGNFVAVLSQMSKEAQRGALILARGGLAACQGMDLVIAGIGGVFIGIALAEKLGLPLLQAYYIPFTPTRAAPSFLVPRLPQGFGGALNRLSYHVARQMMWQGFRSADRLARRDVLDLPAAPFWGPFNADCLQHTPVIYGYSPAVIPRPPDWGEHIHVTGYWFLDPADDWTPPPALLEFLQAGPPPVYVGFGSMSSRKPEETANLIVQALARAEQRAIMLSGWGGLQMVDVPETIFTVDSVPFSWLFPRVAAVVHHGGAGTTSAGLRAGVPSIVVPFFGDQPFWGRCVAELGVGPAPIPRKKLTAERLAQAIQQAVTDQAMRQRAASLGATIQAEDGVARAVAIIEQFQESGVV
ncbi:MAG: glycosyltransferase [Chloroflexi bacterium]|nr:glycosyltransferase [Chloroflexota bacterium]MBU1747012.1 glycosyltransferase [Chloroflexota bacterium]